MFILFVLISCGDSEKKINKTEEVILVDTSKTSSMYREEKVKVKTKYSIDSKTEELRNISEMNETEKAQYKIDIATKKTDCMVEYFKEKESGLDKTYEEYCR